MFFSTKQSLWAKMGSTGMMFVLSLSLSLMFQYKFKGSERDIIHKSNDIPFGIFYVLIDPFHNGFRIGLRFRLDSGKESLTRRPMYSAKMPIESIVILPNCFPRIRCKS